MSMDWNERETSLRYMLGELPLFRVRLRVLRLEGHFTELGDDPDALVTRMGDLPDHLCGLLARGHPVRQEYPPVSRIAGAIRYVAARYQNFFTDLTGPYEAYLKKFDKRSLQERQRKARRLAEHCGGTLDLREYRTPAEMEEFYRHAREVSAKTYQERLLKAGLPEGPRFVEQVREQAAKGSALGYLLFMHGRPAAYQYAVVREGIVLGQYLGYDPEQRKWGPGAIMLFGMMERLIRQGGYRMFDHGQGGGEYKEALATGSVRCADVFYLRPSVRLGATVRLHRGLEVFSAASGRALAAVGVKRLVRKALRRAA